VKDTVQYPKVVVECGENFHFPTGKRHGFPELMKKTTPTN